MLKTLTLAATIALTGMAAHAQSFYAVEIAIQETVTTQVGPFGTASGCLSQRDAIRDDIEVGFDLHNPFGQNASAWGVNAIVHFDDYSIECVRLTQ